VSSPISLEIQEKISVWRRKVADGTITEEEMKQAIVILRQGRLLAANSSAAAKRKKAVAEIPHADDMLADMMKE